MIVTVTAHEIRYAAGTGDWHLVIRDGVFVVEPQVGAWEYASGANLDHLADLIIAAKADAVARGTNWDNN